VVDMTNIRECFEKILAEYLTAKRSTGPHPMRQFISRDTANVIRNLVDTKRYLVEGSWGAGNWASIPWICIFDREITTSATYGFYVCYLFRADMSGVYLSLNQGWTFYRNEFKPLSKAREQIRNVAMQWREILSSTLDDFTNDEIDLRDDGILARGYELGHICGKFYDRSDLPSENVIIQDLNAMIGVYRELRGHMTNPKDIRQTAMELDLIAKTSEEADDKKFQNRIATAEPVYTPLQPQPRMEPRRNGSRVYWPRDPRVARGALEKAHYVCEYDPSHTTFISKTTGMRYVEAHHLVPIGLQGEFSNSLDVTPNIISLCPTCHSRFHYATFEDKRDMIIRFYNERKDQLQSCGIDISLDRLLNAYK
jgi:5-methylcytosine-specific restriction protein A